MQPLFHKTPHERTGAVRRTPGVCLFSARRFRFAWNLLIFCGTLALAGSALAQSDLPPPGAAPARWTLAFYLAGENSLERAQAANFREIIEGAAGLSDVHVVVFFDRDESLKRETPLTSWKGTRVFRVRAPFAETIRRPLDTTLPESIETERFHQLIQDRLSDPADRRRIGEAYGRNGTRYVLKPSGRAQKAHLIEILEKVNYLLPLGGTRTVNLQATSEKTMRQFFSFVRDHFPARHYALFMTGHGNGWYEKDPLPPGSSGRQYPEEYFQTLKSSAIAAAASRQPFDVLALDSCLMADMETLWNLRDSADYLILNQIQTPANGLDYTVLLRRIAADASITPHRLARAVIASYEQTYKGPRYPVSASAFATARIKPFAHLWQEFCALPGNRPHLLDAARSAARIPSGTPTREAMVDLVQLIGALDAPQLVGLMNQMMVAGYRQYTAGRGLSIYLPASPEVMDRTTDLYRQTSWAKDFPQGWVSVVPEVVSALEKAPARAEP